MVRKGNLAILRVVVSPKPERSHPPKLMYMHVTSMLTCMNVLGRFRSIKFFDDHGHKSSSISETGETTPTKIDVHACYIKANLHEFFGLILID